MKALGMKEIRELDKASINLKLSELRGELFKLRLKRMTTGLDKPHLISVMKKSIARLLMVLGEKMKEAK